MKEKGFTLIELLGVIVILSLVMLIAIPNITSTLERSKKEQYLTDATKFVSLVEYNLKKGDIDKPGQNQMFKITLRCLNTNDIDKDPENKPYELDNSYVIIARKDGYLVYYVNLLVSKGNNKYKGVVLENLDDLDKNSAEHEGLNRYNLVKNNVTLLSDNDIKTKIGISGVPITEVCYH